MNFSPGYDFSDSLDWGQLLNFKVEKQLNNQFILLTKQVLSWLQLNLHKRVEQKRSPSSF